MSGDQEWVQDWMTELLAEDKGSYVRFLPFDNSRILTNKFRS